MIDIVQLASQASELLASEQTENRLITPAPDLALLGGECPTDMKASVYDPVICLILQGAKEATVGSRTVQFGAGESLIVSHGLPIISRIIEASTDLPYISLILSIDLSLLREVYHEIDVPHAETTAAASLKVGNTDPQLIDALARYLTIAREENTLKVLGPLVLKEIHYRLLTAEHGAMLRKLLNDESQARQISKAISHIRTHFRTSLSMPELASIAGMSTSSFYEHFKTTTETTPLQYQKELRLIEAQRLLREQNLSVSEVAFNVGYESPTQFSREYSRKFGASPRTERAA